MPEPVSSTVGGHRSNLIAMPLEQQRAHKDTIGLVRLTGIGIEGWRGVGDCRLVEDCRLVGLCWSGIAVWSGRAAIATSGSLREARLAPASTPAYRSFRR